MGRGCEEGNRAARCREICCCESRRKKARHKAAISDVEGQVARGGAQNERRGIVYLVSLRRYYMVHPDDAQSRLGWIGHSWISVSMTQECDQSCMRDNIVTGDDRRII